MQNLSIPDDSGWLDDAACVDLEIADFFVDAGHVIEDDVLDTCRACPVREACLRHAYTRDIGGGYFGGLSPGQRRDMTLTEALEFIENDHVGEPRFVAEPAEEDEDYSYS